MNYIKKIINFNSNIKIKILKIIYCLQFEFAWERFYDSVDVLCGHFFEFYFSVKAQTIGNKFEIWYH